MAGRCGGGSAALLARPARVAAFLNAGLSQWRQSTVKGIQEELSALANSLGARLNGVPNFWHTNDEPLIQGTVEGFDFKAVYLHNTPRLFGQVQSPSLSLIVELPRPNKLEFKMRNKVGTRFGFYLDVEETEPVATSNMEQMANQVIPQSFRDMLNQSGVDYVLTTLHDRVVVTVYKTFSHELYSALLKELVEIAKRLSQLE